MIIHASENFRGGTEFGLPPSKYEGRLRKRRRPSLFAFCQHNSEGHVLRMPIELPPDLDRPGVPIAPPLLFALPVAVFLLVEYFFPTSFVYGAYRWIAG